MRHLIIAVCSVLFLGIGFLFFQATPASAATATWTNGGGDGLWSTCANWSGGTGIGGCLGTSDIATFNSTSVANAAADFFLHIGSKIL